MATNDQVVKVGTQIRFASTDFAPSSSAHNFTIGSPTEVSITLTGITTGNGRNSAKVDLGEFRAEEYEVMGCVDFTGETPDSGASVDCYWAPSGNATAGKGNIAGNSGLDAASPASTYGSITVAEFVDQCDPIGSLITTDDGGIQAGLVGVVRPTNRYGQLVVINRAGDAFEASNANPHFVMNPIIRRIST